MRAFASLLLVLALHPCPAFAETTVDRGSLKMTLPEGYEHKRIQGSDSIVGDILISKPKLKVRYDIFDMGGPPKALSERPEEERKSYIFSEESDRDGIAYQFFAVRIGRETDKCRLFLQIPKGYATFSVDLEKHSEIPAAREALLRIKFALPEEGK